MKMQIRKLLILTLCLIELGTSMNGRLVEGYLVFPFSFLSQANLESKVMTMMVMLLVMGYLLFNTVEFRIETHELWVS